jgi:hypothetical protein
MSGTRKIEEIYNRLKDQARTPSAAIGRSFTVSGFLAYYMRERPRITAWAHEHGLIDFSFLHLRLFLASDFKKRLDDIVAQHIIPAHPYAAKVLENGWRWRILSIREYNLMVYFADFSRKALAVAHAAVVSRGDLYKMTEAYFRLVYHAGQTRTLIAVFKKLFALTDDLAAGAADPETQEKITRNLECLFDADCLRPSLSDIIVAHAMVSHRRFLSWSDLMRPNLPLPVQDRYYECSLAVFEKILVHLQGVLREIAALKGEREGLEWMLQTMEVDGGVVPERLVEFYAELGHSWHGDSGDVFLVLVRLVQGLVERLRELCNDKWQVMTNEEKMVAVKLIAETPLREKVESVATLHETAATRYKLMAPQELSLFRYRDALDPAALCVTENQKFVHGTILLAFSSLYGIAVSLKETLDGKPTGNKPEFYTTQMVVNKIRWRGRSLAEVFDFYIRLILQASSYFRIREVQRDKARLERIDKSLESREKEKAALDATGLLSEHLGAETRR